MRRFPLPWSIEEQDACFVVRNRSGQALADDGDDVLEKYRKHVEHCRDLADKAPDDYMRAKFLRVARLFEMEGRLIINARSTLSESRELLERVNAVLSRHSPDVQSLPNVPPFRATDEQDHCR